MSSAGVVILSLNKWFPVCYEDRKYDLILNKTIGSGGEGWVFEGEYQDCTVEPKPAAKQVAIKVTSSDLIPENFEKLLALNHPSLVTYLDVTPNQLIETASYILVLMEFCKGEFSGSEISCIFLLEPFMS